MFTRVTAKTDPWKKANPLGSPGGGQVGIFFESDNHRCHYFATFRAVRLTVPCFGYPL